MFNSLRAKEAITITPPVTTPVTTVTEDMTLEQVLAAMLQLMKEENTRHYRMGQLYNHVVDKELAQKAGYKDARDYFRKHLADLSQTSLTLYGAVANDFSEPVARRFGVTRLYLLLTYKEAADIEVNHEDPGGTLIEVPDDTWHVTSMSFGECSVDQMRRALQRLRKPASSKPLTPEAEALAEQYSEVVTSRFPRGARVKVAVRNEKGKAVLDFKGIPLEQVAQLVAALSGQLPPVSAVRREVRAAGHVPNPVDSSLWRVRGGLAPLRHGRDVTLVLPLVRAVAAGRLHAKFHPARSPQGCLHARDAGRLTLTGERLLGQRSSQGGHAGRAVADRHALVIAGAQPCTRLRISRWPPYRNEHQHQGQMRASNSGLTCGLSSRAGRVHVRHQPVRHHSQCEQVVTRAGGIVRGGVAAEGADKRQRFGAAVGRRSRSP
jgi:hypothetical protein